MSSEQYWSGLKWQSKRLVLLWLYLIRTKPIEEISKSFLEPKWIDLDSSISPHQIPDYVYMMSTKQLLAALNEAGGPPSWIANKIH